jgi:hypothetical protein
MKKIPYNVIATLLPLVLSLVKDKIGSRSSVPPLVVKRFKNELGNDIVLSVDRDPRERYNGFVITIEGPSSTGKWTITNLEGMQLISALMESMNR